MMTVLSNIFLGDRKRKKAKRFGARQDAVTMDVFGWILGPIMATAQEH